MPYRETLDAMERTAEAVAAGEAEEQCWLLEHPPLYTAGTSAKAHDMLQTSFPVYDAGRGGQYTYHGPGQRVVYVMVNLKTRYAPAVPDVRHFVQTLEQWLIDTLAVFGVRGERRDGRIGIWVVHDGREDKVAALGIKIRKGVSFHGISLNVDPDLGHFGGIVPCGIREYGVTSLHQLGCDAAMHEVDAALIAHCPFL
ncbi:MAG: lipoyl(octanoyl) transferase LipB [Alphaproteobacteria bacterium]|nr:MAG: lipoyl(octanoyl) transferase LipB [Alphaproteobacteria bacterium]TAF75312.1 MAG: lipoyl(octanoyl) transferase LipB [Alphaproteobacteria bacterium]